MSTSFIELTLCHVIVTSTLQNVERYSEHLTTSTLLSDLVAEEHRSSRLSVTMRGLACSHAVTKSYASQRAVVTSVEILLDDEMPIFVAPINKEDSFLLAVAQYPRMKKHVAHGDEHDHVAVRPHLGIVHRIRPSSPLPPVLCPVLVVHVAPWKATLDNRIFTWLQYSPRIVPSMITQEVRMAREIKVVGVN